MNPLHALATHLDLPPELACRLPAPPTRREAALAERQAEVLRIAEKVCAQLTETYLRPALREAGVPDPDRYRFSYGPEQVTP